MNTLDALKTVLYVQEAGFTITQSAQIAATRRLIPAFAFFTWLYHAVMHKIGR